jgi:hypothetical protein
MRRLAFALIVGSGLIFSVNADAAHSARWLRYPTCTATVTTLTCTGTATGLWVRPDRPPWRPMIFTQAYYTCAENPDALGFAPDFLVPAAFGDPVQNGRPFTLSYSPPALPDDSFPSLNPAVDCPSGNWTRNPNYPSVDVAIGEDELHLLLYANLGPINAD